MDIFSAKKTVFPRHYAIDVRYIDAQYESHQETLSTFLFMYVQSKPSIAHSSVVEKPSLVDKSWATNCFYVVKALNSGKPSVVDNFFSEVA